MRRRQRRCHRSSALTAVACARAQKSEAPEEDAKDLAEADSKEEEAVSGQMEHVPEEERADAQVLAPTSDELQQQVVLPPDEPKEPEAAPEDAAPMETDEPDAKGEEQPHVQRDAAAARREADTDERKAKERKVDGVDAQPLLGEQQPQEDAMEVDNADLPTTEEEQWRIHMAEPVGGRSHAALRCTARSLMAVARGPTGCGVGRQQGGRAQTDARGAAAHARGAGRTHGGLQRCVRAPGDSITAATDVRSRVRQTTRKALLPQRSGSGCRW